MATTPTQIRLTDDDLAKLDQIQEWAGLPSLAATVRFCARQVHSTVFGKPGKNPGKNRKNLLDSVATSDIL